MTLTNLVLAEGSPTGRASGAQRDVIFCLSMGVFDRATHG
jgi:hypothetical protein